MAKPKVYAKDLRKTPKKQKERFYPLEKTDVQPEEKKYPMLSIEQLIKRSRR